MPSLLKAVAARHSSVGSTAVVYAQEIGSGPTMADIEDVNRPPESSEDEKETAAPRSAENLLPTPVSTQPAQSKRPLMRADGNRRASKRLKMEKDETTPSTMPETKPLSQTSGEPEWLSQASQTSQKRRGPGYKSRNNWEPPPVLDPATPKKRGKDKGFVALDDTPFTPPSRNSEHKKLALLTQSPSRPSSSPPRAFLIPDDFDVDEISIRKGGTTGDSKESLFSKSEKPRQRRCSDSSLSSVDLLIDYEVDDAMRARLNAIEEDKFEQSKGSTPDYVSCPACKRLLLRSDINLPLDLEKMSLSKQQKFCYDHRIRDAKRLWAEKGYPEIDFDRLGSSSRLRKQIGSLPSVIQRKKTSHYLIALDHAISAAAGNQTTIKRYFDVTALSTIHNGYYGPRGAKVISAAIGDDPEVIKALKKAIKSDKNFRLAGFGRAIDCVLLPEILLRLVIEDMGFSIGRGATSGKADEEARKVLEESVEVGLILCGDDDHVEGMDEDVLDL